MFFTTMSGDIMVRNIYINIYAICHEKRKIMLKVTSTTKLDFFVKFVTIPVETDGKKIDIRCEMDLFLEHFRSGSQSKNVPYFIVMARW